MYWKFQITILSYRYQVGHNFATKRFGGVIMIKGWQRSSRHFTAPFVLYASSCIVSFSNIGSDPSEFIQVISVVAIIDLKTTDALEDAQATPDGPGYSIDRGGHGPSSCRGL